MQCCHTAPTYSLAVACRCTSRKCTQKQGKIPRLCGNNHWPHYCQIAFTFTGHLFEFDRHLFRSDIEEEKSQSELWRLDVKLFQLIPCWHWKVECAVVKQEVSSCWWLKALGILSYLCWYFCEDTVWEVWGAKFFKMEETLLFCLASSVTWGEPGEH